MQADFAGPRVLARAKGPGVIVGASDLEGLGKIDMNEMIKNILAIVVERL